MFNKILIVCLGNICRSPLAEAELKHYVTSKNLSTVVTSAGIAAVVGKAADITVQELLTEKQIDCSAHRARQLTSAMLLESDLVLVMEHQQKQEIEYKFPTSCGKVHLLGKWGGFEIPDPYKQSKQIFKETHQLVLKALDQWQVRLWN